MRSERGSPTTLRPSANSDFLCLGTRVDPGVLGYRSGVGRGAPVRAGAKLQRAEGRHDLQFC